MVCYQQGDQPFLGITGDQFLRCQLKLVRRDSEVVHSLANHNNKHCPDVHKVWFGWHWGPGRYPYGPPGSQSVALSTDPTGRTKVPPISKGSPDWKAFVRQSTITKVPKDVKTLCNHSDITRALQMYSNITGNSGGFLNWIEQGNPIKKFPRKGSWVGDWL